MPRIGDDLIVMVRLNSELRDFFYFYKSLKGPHADSEAVRIMIKEMMEVYKERGAYDNDG